MGVEVCETAEVIHNLTGQNVLHQGIDREITTDRCLTGSDERVQCTEEIPVTGADGPLGAWHGDVQVTVAKSEDAEALSERCHLPEGGENTGKHFGGDAVDFDVDVFVFAAEQQITYISAYVIGSSTLCSDPQGDLPGHLVVRHSFHLPSERIGKFYHSFLHRARDGVHTERKAWE